MGCLRQVQEAASLPREKHDEQTLASKG